MTKKPARRNKEKELDYEIVLGDVAGIVEVARRSALRMVNTAMAAAYWLIGRRIVEFDQGGSTRLITALNCSSTWQGILMPGLDGSFQNVISNKYACFI